MDELNTSTNPSPAITSANSPESPASDIASLQTLAAQLEAKLSPPPTPDQSPQTTEPSPALIAPAIEPISSPVTSFPAPEIALPPILAPTPEGITAQAPVTEPLIQDKSFLPPPVSSVSTSAGVLTPTESSFPKILFLISLVTFVAVFSFLGYRLLNPASSATTVSNDPSSTQEPEPTSTDNSSATTGVCTVGDLQYTSQQTFAAADGCNTCTCNDDGTVVCTTQDCKPTLAPTVQKTKPTVTKKK